MEELKVGDRVLIVGINPAEGKRAQGFSSMPAPKSIGSMGTILKSGLLESDAFLVRLDDGIVVQFYRDELKKVK